MMKAFNLSIIDISDTLSCYGDSTGYIEVDAGLVGTYYLFFSSG